jgi:hypothetical protein
MPCNDLITCYPLNPVFIKTMAAWDIGFCQILKKHIKRDHNNENNDVRSGEHKYNKSDDFSYGLL